VASIKSNDQLGFFMLAIEFALSSILLSSLHLIASRSGRQRLFACHWTLDGSGNG